MANTIEGDLLEESPGQEVATTADTAGATIVYNPLDAEPVAFSRQLSTRQENYDQLRMHLIGVLVPGKDFGRIHVSKRCDNKYRCDNPGHFSGNTLFTSGADKILGILGLGVHYPDVQDYKRAALKGMPLEDIIVDCQVLGMDEQQISVGVGACSRSEIAGGNLNNTIKRACKRARLDAVNRLPVISALFEDDFLDQVEERAKHNKNNTTAGRVQQVSKKWDTGARLAVCPIGKEIKGKPWHEIETGALEWLVANVTDKPDILRAAAGELSKRVSASGPSSIRTPASPHSDDPSGRPQNDS